MHLLTPSDSLTTRIASLALIGGAPGPAPGLEHLHLALWSQLPTASQFPNGAMETTVAPTCWEDQAMNSLLYSRALLQCSQNACGQQGDSPPRASQLEQ